MNCTEFEQICDEFADGMTDGSLKPSADGHLRDCDSCRARFDEVSRLRVLLRDSLPVAAPSTIDAAVMAAFADKHRRRRFSFSFFPLVGFRQGFAAAGVALTAMLAFWLGRTTAPEFVVAPAPVETTIQAPVETIRYVEVPTVKYVEVPVERRSEVIRTVVRDSPTRRRSKMTGASRDDLQARPGTLPARVDLNDFQPIDELSPKVIRKGETYDK